MHIFDTDRLWNVKHGATRWQCLARHRGAVLAWYIRLHGMPTDLSEVVIRQA